MPELEDPAADEVTDDIDPLALWVLFSIHFHYTT
jgi:hypothetical protein